MYVLCIYHMHMVPVHLEEALTRLFTLIPLHERVVHGMFGGMDSWCVTHIVYFEE